MYLYYNDGIARKIFYFNRVANNNDHKSINYSSKTVKNLLLEMQMSLRSGGIV